jgi:hypothetical protein
MGGSYTRRRVLEAAGVAGLGGVLGTVSTAVAAQEWTEVSSPTGKTLTGVEHTAEGTHASGNNGLVIRRKDDGEWTVVTDDGLGGSSKTINGSGLNGDGTRYWMAGNSGVLGEFDVETNTLYDHSKPLGISNQFRSISVRGETGDERLYIGMSSGQVVVGERNGGEQNFNWMVSDTGSGYTVTASDFTVGTGLGSGFVCTNGGEVFRTDDGATSWTYLGYDRSQTSYSALLAEEGDPRQVYVGGGSGRLLRRDCDCGNWTPSKAGSKRIYSLEADNNGEYYLGAGGSGRVYERSEDGAGWNVTNTSSGNALLRAAPATDDEPVDVVVGKSGTILER